MLRKAALSLALVLAFASVAYGLTPAGRWQGSFNANGTPLNARYTFVVKGDTLTGAMDLLDYGAELPIMSGTVRGDSIAFAVDLGGIVTVTHRGRVIGDSLVLAANFGELGGEVVSSFARVP